MPERNVLGFIASGAATLGVFIAMCIWGVKGAAVFVLLSFLVGGFCTFVRLMTVVSSNGMMNLGFLNDNKKLVTFVIVGSAAACAGFALIAIIWIIANLAGSTGTSLIPGEFWFAFVCLILGGIAAVGNVILGFLDMRESGAAPAS